MKIVTDVQQLKQPCSPCNTWDKGEYIAEQLIYYLENTPNAVGIAANQLGFDKRVCVIWLDRGERPFVFINPSLVYKSLMKFSYPEGCLSFPGKIVTTLRHTKITVKHLLQDKDVYDYFEAKEPSSALFIAALQHEIDHLNGVTMFDRECVL